MDILQLVLYGVVIGSIYALGAVGVSLTFSIMRFAHFAHGDMMTFGAYVALVVFSGLALPMWIALPVAMLASAGVAVATDRVLFRRFRKSRPIILLISSFGMALILRAIVQIIWGPANQVYEQGIQMAVQIGGGLRMKPDQMVIIALALVFMLAVHVILTYTKIGKAMRAVADNPELAKLTGIDTERVILYTWAIGGALAGAAGVFLGLDTRLHPEMGWFILLPLFASAILGGIGSPYGAVVGGLVIGISQELSTLVIAPGYKPAVAFAIMVLMLIFRPTGLFAGRSY